MSAMASRPPAGSTPARRFTDGPRASTTVIPAGVSVQGELSCDESLEVDGRIQGPVNVVGLCHVRSNAWVVGEVNAGDAVIEGELEGPLKARGKVELRATARVRGDIEAASVALADGCYFEGHIHMEGGPRVQPRSFHEKRAPTKG
jgi:cytoskeletal protein CcmA (bactofilin family)